MGLEDGHGEWVGELGVAPDDLVVPGAIIERGVDGVAPGVRPVEPLGQVVDGQTVGPSSPVAGHQEHRPAIKGVNKIAWNTIF